MSKPVVLVDMDGVLVDFDGYLYERREMWPSLTIERHEQTGYFLTEHVSDRDRSVMRKFVEESRIFLEADPIKGAIAGLWALAEEADVWICTKPLEANIYCRDDKARWLRELAGPEFENRLIIAPHKGLVHGKILLDDHPKQDHIAVATWKPVIYSQPFNQWQGGEGEYDMYPHFSWDQPVDDLMQFVDHALAWG